MCKKVKLNEFKDNFKSSFKWKSNKKLKQGKVELKGWKAYKVEMVSQEVEAKAKGARGLVTHAYS
jgi:hypothetical protein